MNVERKVDSRTFSNFEILGSYFVNFYFNVVYNTIKRSLDLSNVDASLADAFSEFIDNYEKSIKTNRTFTTLFKEIHDYYQKTTKYCTLVEFEKEILSTFMPLSEIDLLTTKERMSWIAKILGDFICKFTTLISSKNYLSIIIEEHKRTQENARILQNEANIIFYLMREDIRSILAKNKYEKTDRISMDVVNKLRAEFNDMKKKLDEANERCVKCEAEIREKKKYYENIVEKLKTIYATTETEKKKLQKEVEQLKNPKSRQGDTVKTPLKSTTKQKEKELKEKELKEKELKEKELKEQKEKELKEKELKEKEQNADSDASNDENNNDQSEQPEFENEEDELNYIAKKQREKFNK